MIGSLTSNKDPQDIWDEADIQCIPGDNSIVHIISVQNIQNSSSIIYWSFYSCIQPSDYITYYMKRSKSNSDSTTPTQSNTSIAENNGNFPLTLGPTHGK